MANSVLYGLMQQKDLAANTTPQNVVIDIDPDLLISVTLETIAQHNAEIDELRLLFADDTTDFQLFFEGQLTNDLQEGDEDSRPLPVKGEAHYSVGFPLRIAQTGWGANYTTAQQMTVKQFSDKTDQMLIGDVSWHRKWTIGTLLFPGTSGVNAGVDSPYVFTDPVHGAVNVFGLANGDTVKYDRTGGLAPSIDNHYLAQNGPISDTTGQNPFPTIEDALIEHPTNGSTIVAYVSPMLTKTIKALAGFVADPNTYIYTPGDNTATFNGNVNVPVPPSARVLGVYDRTIIIEWRSVPANMIISRAVEGKKPLLYRQYPQAALQGFGPIGYARAEFADKFPYFNEVWYRAGGYGAWDRISTHVFLINAAAGVGGLVPYVMPAPWAALFGM
jgi:hypothetical protein